MALARKRRVGLVKQLAEVMAEQAAAQAIALAAQQKAEKEKIALAGGWAFADGTETIDLTPDIVHASSETIEESRHEHRRTASVEVVFGNDQTLMSAIHDAAYTRGYASFKGIRWMVDTINVPAIRNRSLSFGDYGLTLNLIAMPRRN
jgi:hypothetical protein